MSASELQIVTCIEQGGEFIPIDDLKNIIVKDPSWINGSIRVTSGSISLLTDEHSTDIVQYWGQISSLIADVLIYKKKIVLGGIPGLPVTMRFEVHGSKLVWSVTDIETRTASLSLCQAMSILYEKCYHFFLKIKTLNPASPYDQEVPLNFLLKLAPSLRDIGPEGPSETPFENA